MMLFAIHLRRVSFIYLFVCCYECWVEKMLTSENYRRQPILPNGGLVWFYHRLNVCQPHAGL